MFQGNRKPDNARGRSVCQTKQIGLKNPGEFSGIFYITLIDGLTVI